MISDNWFFLGIVSAIFWGLYVVVLKFAVNPKYLNTPWTMGLVGMSIGILIVSLVSQLYFGRTTPNFQINSLGFWLSILAGVMWALGQAAVSSALRNPETDASKLVVVYNLNTIIAVLGGIVLLNEIPSPNKRIEVILGAILVIAGAILTSRA